MEALISIGIIIVVLAGGLFLFNKLMGYKKGNITIDLDERYIDYNEYIQAIQQDLKSKGRNVTYEGDGRFIIDGKKYIFLERNVSMGGVPLQRTILKPE
ncbi:hypothetical protein FZC79_17590 [Rossellomorea vietnamensis]|uniref:Uncharacterized protein n=1 Tax=Rossellomorea vietnamensis TaxID=218284 RepID=A0A5D4K8T3_9BACI|nr:hypothetical protein [Rossellomorea vietnamensis]TYR73688.1 hypothetical protein FZC79_17590 [Rossellomorea vietnamensis]